MNYIVFDLEANCEKDKPAFQREIIEIGAVKLNHDFEIVDTFECFIKPSINPVITKFCTELTTITNSDVESSPLFSEGVVLFQNWIGIDEPYVLLSWGRFDKKQLQKDSAIFNLPTKWLNNHFSLKHLHHELVLKGKGRAVGMQGALRKAQIPFAGTHHRGIDDAKNIAKIFVHYSHLFNQKIQK